MLEIRLLRYVIAIADLGTITRAAEELHVAQPSLSRQLRAFERRIGFEIFERQSNRLFLTPAGAEFIDGARALIATAESLEASSAQLAEGIAIRLTVHAPPALLTDVLTTYIATRLPKHGPHLDIVLTPSVDRYRCLDDGGDLAICTYPPPSRFESVEMGFVPIYAQVAASHPWAERTTVAAVELAGQDVLVPMNSARTVALVHEVLREAGGNQNRITECPSARIAQAYASAERGVAVASDLPRFGLRTIEIIDGDAVFGVGSWVAWRPGHYASLQLRALAEELADHYRRIASQSRHTPEA